LLKKERRRYLALEIDSVEIFSSKEFMNALWGAVLKLYGEYGASKTGLALIDYDAEKRFALIRVVHTAVENIRAAIASITEIAEKPVAIHVLNVSGTIKTLYTKLKQ
jgi:RNase P/RNase MRP subunit POP5